MSWDSPTRNNAPSVPATSYLPLERECLPVGQATASLLSRSRWHCLILLRFLIVFFYCIFIVFYLLPKKIMLIIIISRKYDIVLYRLPA